jgi:hypothetical protein
VSTGFAQTITRGFAAADDNSVAVCLLPGTEIAFTKDVEVAANYGALRDKIIKERVARFRQIDMDQPTRHHDALEFPNGEVVLLTNLCEGQHASVLQLPAAAEGAKPAARVILREPMAFYSDPVATD